MNNAIETRGLTRRFRNVEAVHDLDLAIPMGSAFAFVGQNGAGKTTTIKLLAGLLQPTRGESFLLGRPSLKLTPDDWRQIGYVSENQRLYSWMPVADLIAFTAAMYPTWDTALAAQLVKMLDLPVKRKVGACSRGQRGKLALLLAIAFHPKLLILDEPFAGLDPLAREEFLTSLLEIMEQRQWSVFFSTHEMDDVERLADHVALLHDGRLQLSEPLERLLGRFRQVVVEGNIAGREPPPEAALVERAESRLRFVHPQFTSDAELTARFRSARVHIELMSLKQIFIAQAKIRRLEHPAQ